VWLSVGAGKPHPDPDHPDYVPLVRVDGKHKEGQMYKVERYERLKRRRLSVHALHEVTNTCRSTTERQAEKKAKVCRERQAVHVKEAEMCRERQPVYVKEAEVCREGQNEKEAEVCREGQNEKEAEMCRAGQNEKEAEVCRKEDCIQLKGEIESLRQEKMELEEKYNAVVGELHYLKTSATVVMSIKDNDAKTKFYTGLPTYHIFMVVFNFLYPFVNRPTKLSLMDEFLLVMMKLRLNLLTEDLAHRFSVSISTVSRIFHKWLDVMYTRLAKCIRWPDRETVRKTLPVAFQKHFPQARCIIDCSEIFIERPTSFKARAQTYSNYKKHNTVKFLIGITPTGVICFLSLCWGGRVSDQELTRCSGFLNSIEPGDVILADRGFLIEDDVAIRGAKLVIPAFTKGKQQLSKREVELSRQMARVGIHVERVIGVLKNRYTILQSKLPISLIKRKRDEAAATVDKLLTVCAAMTNFGEPVV